jgi:ABC-type branched-subunit amino acid transport system ATPase component
VALYKAYALPLALQILAGAALSGLLGFGVGMLTLRLRGIFFSIATIAVAIILETVVLNWHYVGGAKGLPTLRPTETPFFASHTVWLFFVMAVLAVVPWAAARYVETSWIGSGLRAIRDNEVAAECSGVPTLKLKLAAATLSGSLMGCRRRALCPVLVVHRARIGVQPQLRRQRPGDADHRRHGALDRAGDRRGAARHVQQVVTVTGFIRGERACGRGIARGFRCCRARGHSGIVQEIFGEEEMNSLLEIQNLSKNFGGFTALDGVSIDIRKGERFGLIGPNGSGKTTLINCISGVLANDGGGIVFGGEEISGCRPTSARAAASRAASRSRGPSPACRCWRTWWCRWNTSCTAARWARKNARGHAWRGDGYPARHRARGQGRHPSNQLSQVELRKLELARAMAARPQLLISDEAMAGLSSNEIGECSKSCSS